MNNMMAALRLVQSGFRVFGCDPATKRPARGLSWRRSACVQPGQVNSYWKRYGLELMPAIDLAHAGLVVVDLDIGHADGADGIAAFNRLVDTHGEIPICPVIRTPSGGAHVFFAQPYGRAPLGNGEGALPDGINIRGAGGYVVGAGAVRDDGTFYEQVPGTPCLLEAFGADTIPDIPAWLVVIIDKTPERPDVLPRGPSSARVAALCDDKRGREWGLAVLRGEAEKVARASVGYRNTALRDATATVAGKPGCRGWVAKGEAFDAMYTACIKNGYLDDDGEAAFAATFNGRWDWGSAHPLSGPRERLIPDPNFAARINLRVSA